MCSQFLFLHTWHYQHYIKTLIFIPSALYICNRCGACTRHTTIFKRYNMSGRLTIILLVSIFFFCSHTASAGDNNYFQHKKFFYLCSIKKECFYCESCSKEMYKIKIKNLADKKIKSVYYQFYSPLYSQVITREAVIEGDMVDKQNIGYLFVCVDNKVHWTISKIVYEDNSTETFLVEGPLKRFHQEADECDCNVTPMDVRY